MIPDSSGSRHSFLFYAFFTEPLLEYFPLENFVFVLILLKEWLVDGQYIRICRRVSSDDTLTADPGKGDDLKWRLERLFC